MTDTCNRCCRRIYAAWRTAHGKNYHPHCFTCAICDSILDNEKTAEAENLKEVYCKGCHHRYFIENQEIPVPTAVYKTQHQIQLNNERVLSDISQQNQSSSPSQGLEASAEVQFKPAAVNPRVSFGSQKPPKQINNAPERNNNNASKEQLWVRQAHPNNFPAVAPSGKKSSQHLIQDTYKHPLQSGRLEKQKVNNKRMPLTMRAGPLNNRILSPPGMFGPKIKPSFVFHDQMEYNAENLEGICSNYAFYNAPHMKNLLGLNSNKKPKKKGKLTKEKASSHSLLTDAESACFIDPHMMARPIMVLGRQISNSMNALKSEKKQTDKLDKGSRKYKSTTEECAFISPSKMLKIRRKQQQGLGKNMSGLVLATGSEEATTCSSNRSLKKVNELMEYEIGMTEKRFKKQNEVYAICKPSKTTKKSKTKAKISNKECVPANKGEMIQDIIGKSGNVAHGPAFAEGAHVKHVLECPICFDCLLNVNEGTGLLKETLLTPCGHVFHEECIIDWKKNAGNSNCPVCGELWTKKSCTQIFLEANITGNSGSVITKSRKKCRETEKLKSALAILSANYDELKAKYDLLMEQHEIYCDRATVCNNYKAAYEIESRRRQELSKINEQLRKTLQDIENGNYVPVPPNTQIEVKSSAEKVDKEKASVKFEI